MPLKLLITSIQNDIAPRGELLLGGRNTIGRSQQCTIVLDDRNNSVSRNHAVIEQTNSGWWVSVDSKVNGVTVANQELGHGERAELHDGDTIEIADYRLTVTLDQMPQANVVQAKTSLPAVDEDVFAWLGDLNKPVSTATAPPQNSEDFFNLAPSPPVAPPKPLEIEKSAPVDILSLFGAESKPRPAWSGPAGPASAHSGNHVHAHNLPLGDLPPALGQGAAPQPSKAFFGDSVHGSFFEATHVEATELASHTDPSLGTTVPLEGVKAAIIDQRILAAFLRGLGVEFPENNSPVNVEAYMEQAGQVARAAIGGVMNLLLSRNEMKKELRADDRTMLGSKDNNPLKIMNSPEEAVNFIFSTVRDANNAAFMPPLQAVNDACNDILAHEFGLLAGMRAAVAGSIKQGSPSRIEKLAEKHGKGNFLANRKAILWDTYFEWYEKMEETSVDNIDRVFQNDFLSAYQKQVSLIRRQVK